jgi:hypothetical protein
VIPAIRKIKINILVTNYLKKKRTLHELKGQHPPRVLQPGNVQEANHVANKTETQHLELQFVLDLMN